MKQSGHGDGMAGLNGDSTCASPHKGVQSIFVILPVSLFKIGNLVFFIYLFFSHARRESDQGGSKKLFKKKPTEVPILKKLYTRFKVFIL